MHFRMSFVIVKFFLSIFLFLFSTPTKKQILASNCLKKYWIVFVFYASK